VNAAGNLGTARGAIGNLPRLLELLDENIVWVSHIDDPNPPVTLGKGDVANLIRSWVGAWEDFRFEVEDLTEVGDSVLLEIRETGRSRLGGAPMEHRYANIWTFRGGRIIRGDAYRTREDALAVLSGQGIDTESAGERDVATARLHRRVGGA
jgi:ketosteroid isomerase-like protein